MCLQNVGDYKCDMKRQYYCHRIKEVSDKAYNTYKVRHRWVDNNKIDLREIGWDGMDRIDLGQDGTSGGLL
jgi:hypothetical protein